MINSSHTAEFTLSVKKIEESKVDMFQGNYIEKAIR